MKKRVLPLAATAGAFALLALGSGPATARVAHAARCGNVSLTVAPAAPARAIIGCARNVTPHVAVNGDLLNVATLADHANVATFYGDGAVVRLRQQHGRVTVLAVGVSRENVRVWFSAYAPR